MTFSRWARCCAAGILLGAGAWGCAPAGNGPADEEQEPHFQMGRKLAGEMDYDGAVDAYEKALEVNPQSASAHFELACLYEGKENDPAAAIYHYERFLKLAPGSGKAEVAQAHMNNCKLTLAKTALVIAPISAAAQRDLEQLLQENKELKSELAQWQAYYQRQVQIAASNPPVQNAVFNSAAPRLTATNRAPDKLTLGTANTPDTTAPFSARTHTVKAGDTLVAIARKYGVSLGALESANPQARPTRLQIGAVLNVPSS